MCKYEYEMLSPKTGKQMLFCQLIGNDGELSQLCVAQRYCKDKDRYIENKQNKNCKQYLAK